MTRPAIPRAYAMLLCNLADNGGAGELDRHARVLVGATRALIAGGPEAWLRLVTEGYIAGENGKLMLTEAGRAEAKRYSDGLTVGAASE